MLQSSIELVVGDAQVTIEPFYEADYLSEIRGFQECQQGLEIKSLEGPTSLAVTMLREFGGSAFRGLVLIGQKRKVTEVYIGDHLVTSHDDGDVRWVSRLLLGESEDSRASCARSDLSIRVGRWSVCVRWRVGLVT